MTKHFKYKAIDENGSDIEDIIQAKDAENAAKNLIKKGYYVQDLKKVKNTYLQNKKLFNNDKINLSDIYIFSEQFSTMLYSGISIVESLYIISEQQKNNNFKNALQDIIHFVEEGKSLSVSMEASEKVFPHYYCQMIKIGEKAGILADVLADLSEYYKWQFKLKKKIKNSMYYPLLVLITALFAIIILITFVIPGFEEIFRNFNTQLPLSTRAIIGFSDFLSNYYIYIISFILIIALFLMYYYKTERGKELLNNLTMRIPIIGAMKKRFLIWRFTKMISLLLKNGISLLDSIAIIEKIVKNTKLKDILYEMQIKLREGTEFSSALNSADYFPSIMLKMIKAGEKSGNLSDMLIKVSEFLRKKLEIKIQNSINMIEPIIIIFLALVVGFISFSVILPMFNMYSII